MCSALESVEEQWYWVKLQWKLIVDWVGPEFIGSLYPWWIVNEQMHKCVWENMCSSPPQTRIYLNLEWQARPDFWSAKTYSTRFWQFPLSSFTQFISIAQVVSQFTFIWGGWTSKLKSKNKWVCIQRWLSAIDLMWNIINSFEPTMSEKGEIMISQISKKTYFTSFLWYAMAFPQLYILSKSFFHRSFFRSEPVSGLEFAVFSWFGNWLWLENVVALFSDFLWSNAN